MTLHSGTLPRSCLLGRKMLGSMMGVSSEIMAETQASSSQCWKTRCLNRFSPGSKFRTNRERTNARPRQPASDLNKMHPLSASMGNPLTWTRTWTRCSAGNRRSGFSSPVDPHGFQQLGRLHITFDQRLKSICRFNGQRPKNGSFSV